MKTDKCNVIILILIINLLMLSIGDTYILSEIESSIKRKAFFIDYQIDESSFGDDINYGETK